MTETIQAYLYLMQARAELKQIVDEIKRESRRLEIQLRRQAMKETVRYEA